MLHDLCMKKKAHYLLSFIFLLAGLSGCADMASLDPLSGSDSRYGDKQKGSALILANYRYQKKYDLLLEKLKEEYLLSKDQGRKIGQLYSTLDLAEFYTYGFINYKNSLNFYSQVETLNEKIKTSGLTEDITAEKKPISYYKASGRYAIPRKYSYSKIRERITSGRKRINRIFLHHSEGNLSIQSMPAITTLITENYAMAIQVERDILSSFHFEKFEKILTLETNNYFKRKYKLPKSKHAYFINLNILRGLTNVFDLTTLSNTQINKIYQYINNIKNSKPEDNTKLMDTYVDFVEILCLARMGEYEKALHIFENFQNNIDSINREINDYIEYLKTSRDKAAAVATAKTIGFMALAIITMGQAMNSGGGFYIDMTGAGIFDFAGSVSSLQRQIIFTGESNYSKNLNILLNMDDQLQLFRAVGKIYHKMGNIDKSIFFNKKAADIITNLRSSITTERGRISFAGYRDEIYSHLVTDLFRAKKYEEAFYYAESAKARSFVDLLGSKRNLSFGSAENNAYVNKIKEIQIYKDQLKRNVGISDQQIKYINDLEKDLNDQKNRGLMIQNSKNKKQVNNIQKTNDKTSLDEVLDLITVKNLDYQDIQKLLPNDSTLIEYFIVDKRIYVWIIDKYNFFPVELKVDINDLKKDIREFNNKIKSNSTDSLIKKSSELYTKLFHPLEPHINNKSIYLVSHDFLHFLPFEALFTGQEYLVNNYSFSYIPSSSTLQFLKPLTVHQQNLLALGNPTVIQSIGVPNLPGAEQETLSISSLFPKHKIFIKEQATETNLRKETSSHDITHIASHGFFDKENALDSKLFLAADNKNDGFVTVKELYAFPKVSDLVILSACETAQAEISKGNELIGLLRGFFFSGASSLVASLWNVSDIGTLKIMLKFYSYMINNKMPAKFALQKAKQDMIRSKKFNSPFYWAPFNLYGLGL